MASPDIAAPPRAARGGWIGIATALMCALAGGALWCLLALYARRDLMILALPIAIVIAYTLRKNGLGGRWWSALLAAFCVALAAAYSLYLQAVAQVASMLGLPMRDSLMQMEPGMALDIAWANLDRPGMWIVAIAISVAVAATMKARRTR